jgi:hypothetical protein
MTLREKDAGVEMLVGARRNARWILLANPTDEVREVTLDFGGSIAASAGALNPIGEGAPVSIQGGAAKVKLEANGTAALSY